MTILKSWLYMDHDAVWVNPDQLRSIAGKAIRVGSSADDSILPIAITLIPPSIGLVPLMGLMFILDDA